MKYSAIGQKIKEMKEKAAVKTRDFFEKGNENLKDMQAGILGWAMKKQLKKEGIEIQDDKALKDQLRQANILAKNMFKSVKNDRKARKEFLNENKDLVNSVQDGLKDKGVIKPDFTLLDKNQNTTKPDQDGSDN